MTYDEWEKAQDISPLSSEAHYAAKAWDAAIEETRRLVRAAAPTEKTPGGLAVMLDEELYFLLVCEGEK